MFFRLYARVHRNQLYNKMSLSYIGVRCQGFCDCSNEMCDVSTGCKGLRICTIVFVILYENKKRKQ